MAQSIRSWAAALKAFFTTLILGPLFGFLALIGFALIIRVAYGHSAHLELNSMFIIAIPFAYVLGGIQAAIVGLTFSVLSYQRMRISVWVPIVGGVVTGVVFAVLADGAFGLPKSRFSEYVSFVGCHVLAALGCWLIVRNSHKQPQFS